MHKKQSSNDDKECSQFIRQKHMHMERAKILDLRKKEEIICNNIKQHKRKHKRT